ncbi:hypothetical protein [Endozoicomonas lisbonensis]
MDDREVASLTLADKFDDNLLKRVIIRNDSQYHYTIERLSVDPDLRIDTCLDGLMLSIALQEVRINGGQTLYLMSGIDELLWRYIKYGFYPAPERVNFQNKQAGRKGRWFWQGDLVIPFDERYAMSKKHFLYKSFIEISLGYLNEDISKNYKFRGYREKRARGLR